MSLLSRGFQDPTYVTRQAALYSLLGAGANNTTTKYVAWAAMLLYSLNVSTVAAGTSTYTYTVNGTTTVGVAAQQVTLYRVYNTSAAGSSVSLATGTFGPFTLGGSFVTSGTLTNQSGAYSQFVLNAGTGTGGYGGIPLNAGDIWYIQAGTDATATELFSVDYQLAPGAGVTQ